MPGCVSVDINREPATLPDDIPLVACDLFGRVGETEGLDVARGVSRPEAEQRPAGELVILKVGGGLDAGTAVVDFYLFYRVVPSGVGEGIPAGKHECGYGVLGLV